MARRSGHRWNLLLLGTLAAGPVLAGCSHVPPQPPEPLPASAIPIPPPDAGTITGYVQPDDGDGGYANLIVLGTRRGSQADGQGRFVITLVPPGPRQIRVALQGYELSTAFCVVEAGKVVDLGKVIPGKKFKENPDLKGWSR